MITSGFGNPAWFAGDGLFIPSEHVEVRSGCVWGVRFAPSQLVPGFLHLADLEH